MFRSFRWSLDYEAGTKGIYLKTKTAQPTKPLMYLEIYKVKNGFVIPYAEQLLSACRTLPKRSSK